MVPTLEDFVAFRCSTFHVKQGDKGTLIDQC
jgi:hypothetical protein